MNIPRFNTAQRWLLAVAAGLVLYIQFAQFDLYGGPEGVGWVFTISVAVVLLLLALHKPAATPARASGLDVSQAPSATTRADRNVGLLIRFADGMEQEVFALMRQMPANLAHVASDAMSLGRCWLQIYALGLFLILRSRKDPTFVAGEEYRSTKSGLLSHAALAFGSSQLASVAPMSSEELRNWLTSEAGKVERGCVEFGRQLAAGNMESPASALVAWLEAQTGVKSVGDQNLHQFTTNRLRALQAEIS